ncbi:MAG: DUF1127 domain-containing protein [Pseudomonadota bacterium]
MTLSEMITTLVERLRRARERREAIQTLKTYDDALLRDLGITRDEIEDYVDGLAGPQAGRRHDPTGTVVPFARPARPIQPYARALN